jgi:hypothetical protein
MPAPFEIVAGDDGVRIATNGDRQLVALDADIELFRRRGIKRLGSGDAQAVEWAVARLDGVSVYVDGDSVVVTRRDLQP